MQALFKHHIHHTSQDATVHTAPLQPTSEAIAISSSSTNRVAKRSVIRILTALCGAHAAQALPAHPISSTYPNDKVQRRCSASHAAPTGATSTQSSTPSLYS